MNPYLYYFIYLFSDRICCFSYTLQKLLMLMVQLFYFYMGKYRKQGKIQICKQTEIVPYAKTEQQYRELRIDI